MRSRQRATVLVALWIATAAGGNAMAGEGRELQPRQANIQFAHGDGRVAIIIHGMPVAVYVYAGEGVTRPFFCYVRTTGGVQVTRNDPPIPGHDLVDHDTMHRGIWMSFGELGGFDYWRHKARVKHVEFVERPDEQPDGNSFTVRNHYLNPIDSSQVVCRELARYTFVIRPQGYLILWDCRFAADRDLMFGDQEEMGLGIRMATALRVGASGSSQLPTGNGTITNSAGAENEAEVWGKAADWCSYSGTIGGQRVGATVFCHPDNFRPTRFHVRGYGLLVANPFGQRAFKQDAAGDIRIRRNEELRLRYGILIHGTPGNADPDLAAAYSDYLAAAGK